MCSLLFREGWSNLDWTLKKVEVELEDASQLLHLLMEKQGDQEAKGN